MKESGLDAHSPLRLDHVVIAVGDLEQAMADYRALGFTVLVGGQHAGRTSHNALVVFADGAYLELIAWRAPAEHERWYRTHAAHGDGLVDFALLPHDTAAVLAQARGRGLTSLTGPLDGQRLRPDGVQLLWQTARHDTPDLPFLCGDITPRSLRVPESAVRVHGNGATGIDRVVVAVHDLAASLGRYRALLGQDLADAGTMRAAAGTGLREATITLNGVSIVLTTPASAHPAAHEPAPARILRQRLSTRGEGPCALVLRGLSASAGTQLTEARLHGVAMQRVETRD
jgi:catechol 2,3-dioxygenase-like lactoylglutathione lyase family enzyme